LPVHLFDMIAFPLKNLVFAYVSDSSMLYGSAINLTSLNVSYQHF